MKNNGALKVTTPSDREITMTRVFDAPRSMVFDAYTKPELIKRWLTGPPGWTMDICEIDLKVGGEYRFLWRGPDGAPMGMRGIYREISAPERLANTELFDDSWYPGEAVSTLLLVEEGGKTTLINTVLYASQEIRDAVLKSPMADGVAMSYDTLADMLASALVEEGSEGNS